MTTPRPPTKRAKLQRGAAAIVLVLLVLLGLVTLLTFRLDRRQPELDADKNAALAMSGIKVALIGRALINGIPGGTFQNPGALPCPDRNNDGVNDNLPLQCASGTADLPENSGRIPRVTLDTDDLRDASGERFWYILSPEFVDRGNLNPINTFNSVPSLRLIENGVTRQVVALIISPGRPLAGQDRTLSNNLTNYVEGYDPTTNTLTVSPFSSAYNDHVLAIGAQELFTAVTFRMARELSMTAYDNAGNLTGTSFAALVKPQVWLDNDWDNALLSSATTGSTLTLQFRNCAITYQLTGRGAVTRTGSSC